MDKYDKLGVHRAKHIKAAVPQGAILGMEAFVVMIDDLQTESDIDKYVDDTTLSEIIKLKALSESKLQQSLNHAVQWTKQNDMSLNASKTNAMNICFARNQNFEALKVDDTPIETVTSAKLVERP